MKKEMNKTWKWNPGSSLPIEKFEPTNKYIAGIRKSVDSVYRLYSGFRVPMFLARDYSDIDWTKQNVSDEQKFIQSVKTTVRNRVAKHLKIRNNSLAIENYFDFDFYYDDELEDVVVRVTMLVDWRKEKK